VTAIFLRMIVSENRFLPIGVEDKLFEIMR